MYKERKVYVSSCGTTRVCICEGVARDRAFYDKRKVEESRLLYVGNLDSLCDVYRAREFCGRPVTSWFGTPKEARDAAKRIGYKENLVIEGAYIDTTELTPAAFPMSVVFEKDKHGRLFTRLNLHPETAGNYGKLKIYFPDKSLVGADVGEAIITSAKELDRYGFLKGEMVKYEMPEDMSSFLDWAWKNMDAKESIKIIDHPGRGRYLSTSTGNYIKPCDKDHYKVMFSIYSREDCSKYCTAQHTLADLFIADVLPGETSSTLFNKFAKSIFIQKGTRFQGTRWQPATTYISDNMADAMCRGIYTLVKLSGTSITAAVVNPDLVYRLIEFCPTAIDEIVSEVNKINAAADEEISTRLLSGKLHIV